MDDTNPDPEPEPDVQLSFANERTFLAWERTALGLITAGLAITQLLPSFDFPGGRRLIGLPLIALGHRHRGGELVGVAPQPGRHPRRPPAAQLAPAVDRGRRRVRGRRCSASCWSSSRARGIVSPRESTHARAPADERTDMAWNRSGLAIIGCGLIVVRGLTLNGFERARRRGRRGDPRTRHGQLRPRGLARAAASRTRPRASSPARTADVLPLAIGVTTIGVAAFTLGLLFPA